MADTSFGSVGAEIAVGLILAAVLGLVAWARRRGPGLVAQAWRKGRRVYARVGAPIRAMKQRRRLGKLARAGLSEVVGHSGFDPTIVRWDGALVLDQPWYRTPAAVRRDVLSGRVRHDRAMCCGSPPRIGTQRKLS